MNKWLKWSLIIIGGLFLLLTALYRYGISQTKKASPEKEVVFQEAGMDIDILYCSPSAKGRVIFGELVPYDQVWRTGANEATTFNTATDLKIGDGVLKAGHYTFWTIPGEDEWTLIWNTKDYSWGLNFSGVAAREAQYDALAVVVPVRTLTNAQEEFTIDIEMQETPRMVLRWDHTEVGTSLEAAP